MKKLILGILMVFFIVLAGCKVQEKTNIQQTEEQTIPQLSTSLEPKAKELVSNMVCKDEKISATITNVGNVTIDIQKDIKVILRGMVVAGNLLECEKTTLKEGESTSCSNIVGIYKAVSGTNRVVVRLGKSEIIKEINCG